MFVSERHALQHWKITIGFRKPFLDAINGMDACYGMHRPAMVIRWKFGGPGDGKGRGTDQRMAVLAGA